MDIGLILSFIVVMGMVAFALYIHSTKATQNKPINYEPFESQPEEIPYDPTKFDPSISQHIGWLQSGKP